jgi:hypothetical protein
MALFLKVNTHLGIAESSLDELWAGGLYLIGARAVFQAYRIFLMTGLCKFVPPSFSSPQPNYAGMQIFPI